MEKCVEYGWSSRDAERSDHCEERKGGTNQEDGRTNGTYSLSESESIYLGTTTRHCTAKFLNGIGCSHVWLISGGKPAG